MKLMPTKLADCLLFQPERYNDHRGFFQEIFRANTYAAAGITDPLVQDNWSRSIKGVLRGMHFQKTAAQGKLISVLRGEIYDVAVDIRPNSDSFGQWQGIVLSEDNGRQLWLPAGFAHGFLVLSDSADVLYKTTEYYQADAEASFSCFSPRLNIIWPAADYIQSEKDRSAPCFNEIFR
jgi:dTDP-4-dehydrorhamnose 3,5-epimerase